jgi:thymidylate synthase ThyX
MDIFCLRDQNGRLLDPSVQATVLAKYSRSPHSARDVLSGLTSEEANKFHSKWTITYGHSSVAELACVPICFEGISMVASKFVEKFQRAGYSEKSTRYQRFSKNSFINPTNLSSVNTFASTFYDSYDRLYERVIRHSANLCNESDISLPKVKARAFDSYTFV